MPFSKYQDITASRYVPDPSEFSCILSVEALIWQVSDESDLFWFLSSLHPASCAEIGVHDEQVEISFEKGVRNDFDIDGACEDFFVEDPTVGVNYLQQQ